MPSYYRWRAAGERPAQSSRDAAVTTILLAAKSLFLRDGLATTIELIATRAGVARQTVYKLFGSKEQLFGAVVQDLYGHIAVDFLVVDRGTDLPTFLDECGRHAFKLLLSPEAIGLLRITLGEFRERPELAAAGYALRARGLAPSVSNAIADRLERAGAAGEIRAADAQRVAELFIGALTAYPRHRALIGLALPAQAELDDLLATSIDLFLRGLDYRPAPTVKPRPIRSTDRPG